MQCDATCPVLVPASRSLSWDRLAECCHQVAKGILSLCRKRQISFNKIELEMAGLLYLVFISFINVPNKPFLMHLIVCEVPLDIKQATGLFKRKLFVNYDDLVEFCCLNEYGCVQVKSFRMCDIHCVQLCVKQVINGNIRLHSYTRFGKRVRDLHAS